MGLTTQMISWIREETIPRLKQEYSITSRQEFIEYNKEDSDMDMVWLTSAACQESLTDEDNVDWADEIEDFGEEQLILNWVYDWLMNEDW